MANILIKYRDSEGSVSERRISDIRTMDQKSIEAYCHLRKEYRTFKLDRIVQAFDMDTGKVINPWKLINNLFDQGNRETLDSITHHVKSEIRALKFFMKTTRGGRKREIDRLVQYIRDVVDVSLYTDEELSEWIKNIWCGNITDYIEGNPFEYLTNLKAIPPSMIDKCKFYARLIARGSGRRQIKQEWLERIEMEFSLEPFVKKPERVEINNA